MRPWILYAAAGSAITALALYGLVACVVMLRKIIAANLLGSGVFLILVALANRSPGGPPDPVLHALVLTGIVVSVSTTACALALARRIERAAATGAADERDERDDRDDRDEPAPPRPADPEEPPP